MKSFGNLSYAFFSAKMSQPCTYISDYRDFKIGEKDRSPVRIFVAILGIHYVILHHDIFPSIFLFLLHNSDYFLDYFVASLAL